MSSFAKANELYKQGKFQEAYDAYMALGKIFGESVVEYQLDDLKQKMNAQGIEPTPSVKLDDATKIMLANMGKEPLSDDERHRLIDSYKQKTAIKSKDANIRQVNPIPADFPKDLMLAPLPLSTNDFIWHKTRIDNINNNIPKADNDNDDIGLSVIIPTFNRSKILSVTLASLVNQNSDYPFEVIVADDGSSEDIGMIAREFENKLDIKYVRQKDYGYQLCAVRNLGIRTAKYKFVAILDCDMAANPDWVNSYIQSLIDNDHVAYIGPRKYIDTNDLQLDDVYNDKFVFEKLPPVKSDSISTNLADNFSKDWRLQHFEETENLRLCDTPFRYFSGGNVAFAKKWLDIAGWFDEEFTHWGGEDNEFGYRLYRFGCFFQALDGAMAYHQEPPGKENETDRSAGQAITRKIIGQKVPYFYRKLEPIGAATLKTVPLVSIYIPAYNCQDVIVRCVESALNQTVTDLEVCICDDGSTDNTLDIIEQNYTNHPRVRFVSQTNGGIAKSSNTAVRLCRGYYIAQLDSDDYLEPDAVELCLKEFLKDKTLACVYTTNRNVNPDGSLIADGYNWPIFSREKLTTAMIVHHFRMFTARAWHLAGGFDETLENSVDLDIYLKLSEIGQFKHINKICYNRVLHGDNTSVKNLDIQKKNHYLAINKSLKRQGINYYSYDAIDDNKESRKYVFNRTSEPLPIIQYKNAMYLAFSLVYPDEPKNLLSRLNNIIEYNPSTVAVVVHIDKQYTAQATQAIDEFNNNNDTKVIVSSDIAYDNYKYRQVEYHANNFEKLEELGIAFDYVVLDNYDSLCVQYGMGNYMARFDVGMNFGEINGYWKDKILAHQTLNRWVQNNLNTPLTQLRCKGVAHGLFIKKSITKAVFEKVASFWQLCIQNNDLPAYPTEEILPQLMVLAIEYSQNKAFAKTATLTYMPWERKLQWSDEQIEYAKRGIGLPNGKFLISRVY